MALEKGKEEKKVGENPSDASSGKNLQYLEEKIARLESLLSSAASAPQAAQSSGLTNEGLAEALKLALEASERKNLAYDAPDEHGYVNEADLDPDDVLEDGHPFYCHQAGYFIIDDLRNGRPVRTPSGRPIKFEFLHSVKKFNGKDVDLDILSRYISYSKKEVEWIKRSNFYGWTVFDDIATATSKKAKLAGKIQRYLSAARSMERGELIKACKSFNIPVYSKIDEMRLALATAYAEKEMIKDEKINKQRTLDAVKEEELVKEVINR